MGCYVYEYVFNNEIIYIGKSNTDLVSRIKAHGKEGDNIPEEGWAEINASKVYYAKLANKTMSDVVESELIRRYKPKYNKQKKSEWDGLPFVEPEWHELKDRNYEPDDKYFVVYEIKNAPHTCDFLYKHIVYFDNDGKLQYKDKRSNIARIDPNEIPQLIDKVNEQRIFTYDEEKIPRYIKIMVGKIIRDLKKKHNEYIRLDNECKELLKNVCNKYLNDISDDLLKECRAIYDEVA